MDVFFWIVFLPLLEVLDASCLDFEQVLVELLALLAGPFIAFSVRGSRWLFGLKRPSEFKKSKIKPKWPLGGLIKGSNGAPGWSVDYGVLFNTKKQLPGRK